MTGKGRDKGRKRQKWNGSYTCVHSFGVNGLRCCFVLLEARRTRQTGTSFNRNSLIVKWFEALCIDR